MREIKCEDIIKTVKQLCIEAACDLPSDVLSALINRKKEEPYALAKKTIDVLIDNANLAHQNRMPICQDTGMAFVYVTIGQEVHVDGDLKAAINEGVRQGYSDGYLCSVMQHTLALWVQCTQTEKNNNNNKKKKTMHVFTSLRQRN